MKDRLIRWLLRRLGYEPPPPSPFTWFYTVVTGKDRVAEVTTNRFRARALALERQAKGEVVAVWKCVPTERISIKAS